MEREYWLHRFSNAGCRRFSLVIYVGYQRGRIFYKACSPGFFLGRDQRALAESLAEGRIAVMVGLAYYFYFPFIKSGLLIKGPAHPNCIKIFVNWLLSREGQEIVSTALGRATRRLDVDTKCLREPAQKFAQAILK
jgi:hypothetical protein